MNDSKHSTQEPKKLPIKYALLAIILSIFFVSGTSILVLMYYQHLKEKKRGDASYHIVAIVQTSPNSEGLKTGYLAELLELSEDHPTNLYAFDMLEAEKKLLRLPVIKEARIKKIRPGTLHVNYVLRKPIAFIGDSSNTAIDATGTIFPFKPFYTPKKLPEIILGKEDENVFSSWGSVISGKSKDLAFTLLEYSTQYCDEYSSLNCIDVSNAFAQSDGERQIVLILEDRIARVVDGQTILSIHPRILRLRQENFQQQLGNYLVLRSRLRENDKSVPLAGKGTVQHAKAVVVDLRLSELAFISSEK